jgi:glutamate dehydrogenase/leucine dehydrogenase
MSLASLNFDTLSPSELAQYLKAKGIRRFYFVYNPSTHQVETSHPEFNALKDQIQADQIDYEEHEGLFFEVSPTYDVIYGACIHRTCRGQGQGGTRFWQYDRFIDFMYDGIRLSKGMTHKNALAGLWWGGGKGVISRPQQANFKDPTVRHTLFAEYGAFMSSLRGCYITAEDVGTNTTDMGSIFSKTRFITCIPGSSGGSGNPSSATALGVVRGMEAGLDWLAQQGKIKLLSEEQPLNGKSIVVQGAGHVGEVMIDLMLEQGARVYVTDISADRVRTLQKKWSEGIWAGSDIEVVLTDRHDTSFLSRSCDVLCPAATGAILN